MRLVLLLLVCFPLVWSMVPLERASLGSRIIGGTVARAGQFPWQAALQLEKEDGRYFCGGSLITNQFVLTAGHCVDGVIQFTIYLGSNTLQGQDDNRVALSTSISVLHPDYDPTTLENDIGLIKLHMPVALSAYIQPINAANRGQIYDGITVTAAGWGQTSDSTAGLNNDLSFVTLSIISNTECQLTFGNQIKYGMVCAVGNYNEGICVGDTGGAIVKPGVKGDPLHVGVASFMSQNGCETPEPTGYTRTDVYHDWIMNVTRS